MTAVEIIEEIKRLPKDEQAKVLEFAQQITVGRLTPEQLGELARRMAEAPDNAEADRLQQEIIEGFYGRSSHA